MLMPSWSTEWVQGQPGLHEAMISNHSKALSYASHLTEWRPVSLEWAVIGTSQALSPTWGRGREAAASSSAVATSYAAALGAISCHCWPCSSGEKGRKTIGKWGWHVTHINYRNIARGLESQRNPKSRKSSSNRSNNEIHMQLATQALFMGL